MSQSINGSLQIRLSPLDLAGGGRDFIKAGSQLPLTGGCGPSVGTQVNNT